MSVTDYEMRFTKLFRHATILIPSKKERVRRFIGGLHHGIRLSMDREVEFGTSFHQDVEIACHINHIHSQTREMMQGSDKRSRYSGSFIGASYRG